MGLLEYRVVKMEINKRFTDIGSITKSLLKHLDLTKVYIAIGLDANYPNNICIKLMPRDPSYGIPVTYVWHPGTVQNLNIPDQYCAPFALTKKQTKVESIFERNARNRPF